MKKVILLFFVVFSFAFKVEFNNKYETFLTPTKKAILITKVFPINYKDKIITNKGVILLDYENADDFVRNSLYLPKKAEVKDVNIAIFDVDKIRFKIIKILKNKYKTCQIQKIEFLDDNSQKVYFKPTSLKIKYRTILNCK